MGQIRLGLGTVNITDYLIVIARKTTTPLVEEAREVYSGPQPTTRNVVVPATGDIDPVIYYVDIRESPDGTTLGLLLIQFVYDLKNNIILSEKRYYLADGPGANDPASGQDTITDSYLDGKTISTVYKEGFRPLVPPDYTAFKEYDLVSGGGIQLLNGQVFGPNEVMVIEISYLGQQSQTTTGGGLYNGVITLTSSTSLGVTHRNKRLKCESSASAQQVHTLEDVTSVPDGTFYHFTFNGGNQLQTKIIPTSGQTIQYAGDNYTEITIGKGEYLRIECTGSIWEAILVHDGVLKVGEPLSGRWKDHPNTMPEDARLLDGDDYPRIYWWLRNKLPSTHKITDDTVTSGGYVHPVGKEGLFVIHSTLKKFRMPNTQNISEKGLKDFDSYGTDAERVYDYPGGVQNDQLKEYTDTEGEHGTGIATLDTYLGGPFHFKKTTRNAGLENRVKTFGVIYLRRI